MPTYTVQGPSGKTYTIEGPDGATADQLGQHILSQSREERIAVQQAQDRATYNPTNDMSGTGRFIAGMGSGTASILRAVGGGSLAAKLGLPATKEEGDALDAPLLDTRAGKVGRVVGQAATLAPAALIPGANTYTGAALIGAGLGGATTEGDAVDRLKGAALGGAGGVVGQGVGQAIGAGVSRLAQAGRSAAQARQVARAGKDIAADNAQAAGYVLPPTEVSPGGLSSLLEGVSGKVKTSQAASQRNQAVTNKMAADELGLPANAPITRADLQNIRDSAGQVYDAVASSGQVTPGQSYATALDAIVANSKKAQQGFPNAKENPLIGEIDSIRIPPGGSVDAGSVVSKIRELRAGADAAYGAQNKELGKALKSGADALEDVLDQHLTATGAPANLLNDFRNARTIIAKTYSVEKALNPSTGDVSAAALASQLKRGKPLSGGLKTAAEANTAFPKATQTLQQDYNAVSPLDYLAGAGTSVATGNPLSALTVLGRPGVRSAVLSGPAQNLMRNTRNYRANPLLQLLDAASVPGLGTAAGVGLLPRLQQ